VANWSDNLSIVAATTLARGSSTRGTIDWRTKYGGFLFCKVGRTGTNALTDGVSVIIRRVINNDGATAGAVHPSHILLTGGTAAANSTTINSDSNSAQNDVNVSSISGFSAGDFICIQDSGGGVTRLEWHRVAKTATGVLTLDRPLLFSHTAVQADTVRNKSDIHVPTFVDGGSLYEVIFDYCNDTSGDSVTVQALGQSFDS